ncbi:MAG TPA: hypothetical protein VIT41_01550 [Microlunatus sp.]
MGRVSAYLRHRLLADVLAVLGGWPDPPRRTRVHHREKPQVPPSAQVQDGWPLLEDAEPPNRREIDPTS